MLILLECHLFYYSVDMNDSMICLPIPLTSAMSYSHVQQHMFDEVASYFAAMDVKCKDIPSLLLQI